VLDSAREAIPAVLSKGDKLRYEFVTSVGSVWYKEFIDCTRPNGMKFPVPGARGGLEFRRDVGR